ncbi:MAG: hypothetical protein JKY08_12315 [Flavobacteriaceae bacterium]|nr:hypothetical protein [Flavobacteriaceae bacterium]
MKNIISFVILALFTFLVTDTMAQNIANSKHNLGASGKGKVKSMDDDRVCAFCHVSHSGNPKAPMWNRKKSGAVYTLYTSSTLNATLGQPDGTSVLCLSCHDGKVALAMSAYKNPNQITYTQDLTSRGNLGTDLSNDHPISFVYDASLATADGQLKDPSTLDAHVLDNNNKVQCTSCHDPHKDLDTNFLRKTREFSLLCYSCHDPKYWANSIHNTSTKSWNGNGDNPWGHLEIPYETVAQNGCANCHDTHNAQGRERLLKHLPEEEVCFDCHNGNVSKDIRGEFAKPYGHKVFDQQGVHDPTETNATITKHAECVDCHNPHAVNGDPAVSPEIGGVKGSNRGVDGIDKNGNEIAEVTYEYELCFKCHSDKVWTNVPAVIRQFPETNMINKFNRTDGGSFHPVVNPRNNPDSERNLLNGLTMSSIIYCTDCHGNDNKGGAQGPHGSNNKHLLKLRYDTGNNVRESASRYALCYSCHSRSNLLGKRASFELHEEHVDDEKVSCSTCHDPHGSPQSNLINFNTALVKSFEGRLEYQDLGVNRGRCFLTCHGKKHDGFDY